MSDLRTSDRPERGPVLLYDGACGLCLAVVRRLRASRHGHRISYVPLQDDAAQPYLAAQGLPTRDFSSLVFVPEWTQPHGASYLLRTDGMLAAFAVLGGSFRLLAWLRFVPRPIRDGAYAVVARIRHWIPTGSQ